MIRALDTVEYRPMNSIVDMRRILSASACHKRPCSGRHDFPSLVSIVSAILTFSNSTTVRRLSSTMTGLPVSELTTQLRYGPERGTR